MWKKSKETLNKLNIYTIKDLAQCDKKILERHFKSQATYLKEASLGIDESAVATRNSKNASISTSQTLPYDLVDEEKIKEILFRQTEGLTRELREKKLFTETVAVIYKNKDFTNYSAQAKLKNPTDNTKEIFKLVISIFEKSFKREPIRLIGVRLADLQTTKKTQLSLFDNEVESNTTENEMQKTIDEINKKFGKSIVAPASLTLMTKKTKKR